MKSVCNGAHLLVVNLRVDLLEVFDELQFLGLFAEH